jgi:2-amino-4-hydroxy-6-hydroxymethyldihydropteridine diphosphokinase
MSSQPNTIASTDRYDHKGLAFIALGSNLASPHGSPHDTIEFAFTCLQELSQRPLLRSSVWLSEPMDCPPESPLFHNAVVGLAPLIEETPASLLKKLQQIEGKFGRAHSATPNAPRTLDLDIICYGQHELDDADLVLPHPAAHRRLFVMRPMSEIAPDLIISNQDKPVTALAAECQQQGQTISKAPRTSSE